MPDSEGSTSWNDVLRISGVVAVLGVLGYGIYVQKARNRHIEAVMNGPLRADKDSRIYHVPTCPQYHSIDTEDLRLFDTIEQARLAGYDQARNCGDDFHIREVNETQDPEPPDHPGDPQFR